MIFNRYMFFLARLFMLLLLLFSAGRLFYLADYVSVLQAEPHSFSNILLTLVSAVRFDSTASAFLLAPAFLLGFLTFLPVNPLLQALELFKKIYAYAIVIVAWLAVVGDHYFYIYFKDHFNVFFWEFWDNLSNADLVVGGLDGVVPLSQAFAALFGGGAFFLALTHRLIKEMPAAVAADFSPKHLAYAPLWVILFFAASRGTFDSRPLLLQDRRLAISQNNLVNLLHTNPFLPLYRGLRDKVELQNHRSRLAVNAAAVKEDFAAAAAFIPGAKVRQSAGGYHYLTQTLDPLGDGILKRRPKHIVLLFMESYSSWLMEVKDDGFNEAMTGNLIKLKKEGLYFSRHFPSAAGTIKNITNAILSFPQPRGFHPSANYHPEILKPFPDILSRALQKQGYAPRFYYGGQIAWHRLYQFLPVVDFRQYYAEHSYPEAPHHRHGIYDMDLFAAVDLALQQEKAPTFSFVMSLCNHPPYPVPDEFNNHDLKIPASLRKRMIVTEKQIYERFNAFRYADYALGRFFEEAKHKPYFKDTLFVITGDHPFGGGVSYPQEWGWWEESIPLLFYAPDLLQPQWVGKELDPFTTHLDLLPTFLQLVTRETTEITTWGKSVFRDDQPSGSGINFYFSCLEGYCLKKGQVYRLQDDLFMIPDDDPSHAKEVASRLRTLEESYYNSGLHYFYQYRTTAH